MVDSADLVDDVDAEKIHLRGYVHSVHNVHSVRCVDKSIWLRLPNLGSIEIMGRRKETAPKPPSGQGIAAPPGIAASPPR
jgi:hypothetical protein